MTTPRAAPNLTEAKTTGPSGSSLRGHHRDGAGAAFLAGPGRRRGLGFRSQGLAAVERDFQQYFLRFLGPGPRGDLAEAVDAHRRFILAAVVMTTLFFITYVTYHYLAPSTPYGGDGVLRYVYYFVLLTHIPLARAGGAAGRIALFTGLNLEVRRHRRIAKWAMPLWLYVSVTGVLVYILISPDH